MEIDDEELTLHFRLIHETETHPVKVRAHGTVLDLIDKCSQICKIPSDSLNLRTFQKNMVRAADLDFYHLRQHDLIVGGKSYEATVKEAAKEPDNKQAEDVNMKSIGEDMILDNVDSDEDREEDEDNDEDKEDEENSEEEEENDEDEQKVLSKKRKRKSNVQKTKTTKAAEKKTTKATKKTTKQTVTKRTVTKSKETKTKAATTKKAASKKTPAKKTSKK